MRKLFFILSLTFSFLTAQGQTALTGDPRATVAANGQWNGHKALLYQISGRRSTFNNTTSFHDIVLFETDSLLIPVLTSSDSLEMVSSSTSDDAAGTGARTIRVVYIDTLYQLQESSAIELDGTTAVGLPFRALDILWAEVVTAGSLGVSAGTITFRINGGVDIESIPIGRTKSQAGRFMVPDGWTAYIIDWSATAIAQSASVVLRAQSETKDKTISSVYVEHANSYLASGQSLEQAPWVKVPERGKIKVSALVGATSNAIVDTKFTVLLLKDTE
jgi:hypothetical protein